MTCSAGTFIRSIARDLGTALGVGGHLIALRRIRVAGFTENQSVSIADLKAGSFTSLALADVARNTFSVRELSDSEVIELSFGRALSQNSSDEISAGISPDNRLVALLRNSDGSAKPIAVFAAAN